MRRISAPLAALLVALCTRAAVALPGDSFAAERTRLAAIPALLPLSPLEGVLGRWSTHPRSGGDETRGDDGWSVTVVADAHEVKRESLDVKAFGKPYAIVTDGATTFAIVFGAATARDLASSAVVATQHEDAQVTQIFRRGARFGYRVVDDQRNGLHTLELFPLPDLPRVLGQYGLTTPGTPGDGTIFVVQGDGAMTPVAVRSGETFVQPPSTTKTAPPSNVHLIFGDRTIASIPVTTSNGKPSITVPSNVHLGGNIDALASPSLNGTASTPRRAPSAAERASVLIAAATKLGTEPSALQVRNLTALDLGHGTALAGTVNWPGTGSPRTDHRVFFVAETIDGKRTMTLWNVQTITVTEPLLEEPAEYLVDALDIGHNKVGLVTHIIGYDADAYTIYTRSGDRWKSTYAGGGVAL
jgi:hypothetical protein